MTSEAKQTCPECGEAKDTCGSWGSYKGRVTFHRTDSCKTIADLKAKLQSAEDELGPLREMRGYVSDGFRDQGGMGDPWGSIYGDLLSEWAKATARRNREKGEG